MKLARSLRWRIQLWHGGLLLAVVAAFGLVTAGLLRAAAWRRLDTELESRLGTLTSLLARNRPERPPRDGDGPEARGPERFPPGERPRDELGRPAPPPRPPQDGRFPGAGEDPENRRPEPRGRDDQEPDDRHPPPRLPEAIDSTELSTAFDPTAPTPFYYVLWAREGGVLQQSATAPADVPRPPLGSMVHTLRTRGGYREASVSTPPGETLLVGQSIAPLEHEERGYAWRLAALGAGVLVLGLAGGWFTVGRMLRPVGAIGAAARRVAEGQLAARIAPLETESELGRLAALLDDTFARLEAAFAEQERFTSDAAHELRTPVSVILAQTQLALARERSAAEHRTTIEACRRAALRMQALIEALLQLAQLDAGAHSLDLQLCDLAEIGREQLEMIRPLADERGLEVSSQLDPAPCIADPQRTAQIVVNLLSNAVKFSSPGCSIALSTREDRGRVFLCVRDTGPGIAAEDLPHLFERFYRADRSRNRATGGAGLGLAICKTIAEAHGGKLEVASSPGEGSVFTLSMRAAVHVEPTERLALGV